MHRLDERAGNLRSITGMFKFKHLLVDRISIYPLLVAIK